MSNYSLKGIADSIDNLTINPQSSSTTSVTTLVAMDDASGVTLNLTETYVGICYVRFGATGADSDDGPNPRPVIANSTNVSTTNNEIQVEEHGLGNGDIIRFTTSSGSSSTGTLPGGLLEDTDYYVVDYVHPDSIKVSTTSGGSAISITDVGSGTFYVTRNTFVALDAQDWLSTGSSAVNVLTINFKFKYGVQAYKWISRYTNLRKVAFLVGLPEDRDLTVSLSPSGIGAYEASWNSTLSSSTSYNPKPAIMGGSEWENLEDVYFFGLLLPQKGALTKYLGKATGAISYNFGGQTWSASGTGFLGNTNWAQYTGTIDGISRDATFAKSASCASYERCRLRVNVSTPMGNVFWFRYTTKLWMSNITWKIVTWAGGSMYNGFVINARISTIRDIRIEIITAATTGNSSYGTMEGNSAPIRVAENAGLVYVVGSLFQVMTGANRTDPDMLGCGDKTTFVIDPNYNHMYVNFYSGLGSPYREYAKIIAKLHCSNASQGGRGFRLSLQNWVQDHGSAYYGWSLVGGQVVWNYNNSAGTVIGSASQPTIYYYGNPWIGQSSTRFLTV